MGKGRAPCCDKNKVKRGPWSPQEDLKLITFIQKHGHENWRSLPKQAGLLRCGKSCRLRWINYLRPDVKRGNFTKEEEEAIIKLHEALGNKWSKIASELPGRTDNEIKNVWHTHLKKKFLKNSSDHLSSTDQSKQESSIASSSSSSSSAHQSLTTIMPQKITDSEQNSEDDQVFKLEESPPTSFYSTDHDQLTSICKSQEDQELITAGCSLYQGGHDSYSNNTVLNEVVDTPADYSSGLLDIPLEADEDFWNMLDNDYDNIGGCFQSDEQVHSDAETRKWISEMEKELGLEPQAFDLSIGFSDLDIWPNSTSGF